MATYTEKLGLKMPAQTDFYNVDDFNENFRKIDENMAMDTDIKRDIQQVLTLADPIRSNRAPTTADAQYAGKLWVVPKIIFNNMMPNALAQATGNWRATAATVSTSGTAATIVGDGTASTIVGEVDMTAVNTNDIVYIAAKMTVTADANGAVLELLCGDEVIATTSMNIPVAGNNIRLIGHTKVDTAGALKLRVTTIYNSASAQLGKGVTVSDITILDLTADMCQNFAGIEFSKDTATTYVDTYGNFQTKTYELSEYWWICRGSYGGQYSWQRYDDYTNAKIKEYSDNYQNSKATTAEAQAGTNDAHWITPLKSQQFFTNRKATTAEAQAGTNDTHWVSPLALSAHITANVTPTLDNHNQRLETLEGTHYEMFIIKITASCILNFKDAISDVFVLIFGGGAGGNQRQGYGGPGGGHMAYTTFTPDKTKNYSVTIGAGGSDGKAGGTTTFDSIISAAGGSPGTTTAGGAGGSGGGAPGTTAGVGGAGSYGGGGGGVSRGGNGGTYGGGGGALTGGTAGTKGTYGGNGGVNAAGSTGTPTSIIPAPFDILHSILPTPTSTTSATGGAAKNGAGGGGGGYGSAGGSGRIGNNSYTSGGGGGGGFFGDGGDGGTNTSGDPSGCGGGGGFFGKGGDASTRCGGGGGGGFCADGGNSQYSGAPENAVGFAAGGYTRSGESNMGTKGYGGQGICIVAYFRKVNI